jgi:hypothetical protein
MAAMIKRAFMGKLQFLYGQLNNIEIDTPTLVTILTNLSTFVSTKESLDLAVLLGVAYDTIHPDYDRRRFKYALNLLARNSTGRDQLVLCVDPNFSLANIAKTFATLVDTTFHVDPLNIILDKKVSYISEIELVDKNVPLIETTIVNAAGVSTKVYFLFIKYALTSEHRRNIFFSDRNLINVQKGTKTISTYIEDEKCQYGKDTFYGALETLATQPTIKSVYVASSVSSHRIGFLEYNNTTFYKPQQTVREFGDTNKWWIDNRYLQGFCEILTCMKKIRDAGKPVFYINLDRIHPTFTHSSVEIAYDPSSKEPYLVPFLEDTVFSKNNPFEIYVPPSVGGKRKQTRKASKKRSTRKHKRRV